MGEKMAKDKAAELDKVKRTSPQQMWLTDLDQLERAINDLYAQRAEEADGDGKGKKRKAAGSGRQSRGRKQDDEEGDAPADGDDEDGEGSAMVDPFDNPFGDVARWTMGALKSGTDGGPAMKRRRTA